MKKFITCECGFGAELELNGFGQVPEHFSCPRCGRRAVSQMVKSMQEYWEPPKLIELPEDTMLTCDRCGKTKPYTEFHRASTNNTGRRGKCGICIQEINKERKTRREKNVTTF